MIIFAFFVRLLVRPGRFGGLPVAYNLAPCGWEQGGKYCSMTSGWDHVLFGIDPRGITFGSLLVCPRFIILLQYDHLSCNFKIIPVNVDAFDVTAADFHLEILDGLD